MRFKFRLSLFFMLAIGLTPCAVHAHTYSSESKTDEQALAVLENRSEFMKNLGSAMKAFTNYLRRGDGNPSDLSAMAREIADNAPGIPDLFPENTGIDHFEDSEAIAAVWENWPEFVAAANELVEPAQALATAFAAVADGVEDAEHDAAARFRDLGRIGCKSCHDRFRDEDHDHSAHD